MSFAERVVALDRDGGRRSLWSACVLIGTLVVALVRPAAAAWTPGWLSRFTLL